MHIINKISWNPLETERSDLRYARVAQALGYALRSNKGYRLEKGDTPLDCLSFAKEHKSIWRSPVTMCWQCADLIDGRYTGHRSYNSLMEALRKERDK